MTDDFVQKVIQETTDDWLEVYENPENQNGFEWRLIARGVLPDGVDVSNERVCAVVETARKSLKPKE